MSGKETIFEWLRDAYAMETALQDILEGHAKDASGRPHIADRLQEHLRETREHAETLRICLEANGQKTSGGKNLLGKAGGKILRMATGPTEDELVKNCLTDFANEHFEIACYKSLIAAAQRIGMGDVVAVCQGILAEEEEMADWVGQQIPLISDEFIGQQEARRKKEDQPRRRAAGG